MMNAWAVLVAGTMMAAWSANAEAARGPVRVAPRGPVARTAPPIRRAPNINRPVTPNVRRPVQPTFNRPVQPNFNRPVQPNFNRPLQPKFNPVRPPVVNPVRPPVVNPIRPPQLNPVRPPVVNPVRPIRPYHPPVVNPVRPRPNVSVNITWNSRNLLRRTWFRNNISINRYYHPYTYRGHAYHGYFPVRYYPSFRYSFWIGGRWRAPVARYHWWWWYSSWYRPYVSYFQPYPTYLGPSYWLTDFVIGNILAADYRAQIDLATLQANIARGQADEAIRRANEAEAALYTATAIGEAEKEQLRRQVTAAITAHQQQQGASLEQALGDSGHLFAISESLSASYLAQTGETVGCPLTPGDLVRTLSVDPNTQIAQVVVVTSKPTSCPVNAVLQISLGQLAEFENDFYEQVDQGLEQLSAMPNP